MKGLQEITGIDDRIPQYIAPTVNSFPDSFVQKLFPRHGPETCFRCAVKRAATGLVVPEMYVSLNEDRVFSISLSCGIKVNLSQEMMNELIKPYRGIPDMVI